MSFRIGQEVVCVDDSRFYGYARKFGIVKGEIYTVVGHRTAHGNNYVELMFIDKAWRVERFRPVQKTDISELVKLTKVRELEDV